MIYRENYKRLMLRHSWALVLLTGVALGNT